MELKALQKHILLPSLMSIALLITAIFPIKEYGFYILLRWVVCLAAIFIAYFLYDAKKFSWAWLMGIIAIIFNPILPIHLTKEIWRIIDLITAIIFGLTFFMLQVRKEKK